MTLDDVLYGLDTLCNSEALSKETRSAARYAHRHLVAFKCARRLDGDTDAALLSMVAWETDESSRRDAVPQNKICGAL